ncbi:159_t:CDS:2, partial [Acaulospora colombiana]
PVHPFILIQRPKRLPYRPSISEFDNVCSWQLVLIFDTQPCVDKVRFCEGNLDVGARATALTLPLGDIYILDTTSLESTGPISDPKRRTDCIHTKMLLKASDSLFLLFKKSTKVYSIYWLDKEYSSTGKRANAEDTSIFEYNLSSFARHLVDVRIDSECEAIKMKSGCLMMVTARPTLHVFDLNLTLSGPHPSELAPITECDFTFAINNTSPNQYIATSCIDFDEQRIFHCTDVGFRIVSRTTLE